MALWKQEATARVREASLSCDCRSQSKTDPPALQPKVTPSATTTPLRILVVDDNRESANALAMLRDLSGHETHTVYDGPAVEAAIRLDPDVILLNIGLPGLNGYEAARRIRNSKERSAVRC